MPQAAPPNTTDATTDAEVVPLRVELDIPRLLSESTVDGEGLSDPVWQIEASNRRVLTLLPLRITPGGFDAELARPDISLGGGRFLCWWVPPRGDESQPTRQRRRAADPFGDPFTSEAERAPRFVAGDHRFARFLGDPNADPMGRERVAAVEPAPQVAGPRLARRITITAVGTVAWELDRAIPNATVGGRDNLYALKLDPQQLQALAPQRPDRLTRNSSESTREFNQRRQEAQQQMRQEQAEYRATREAVSALPDRFEEPLPAVVWAVFERSETQNTVSFEGPAPLPWSLPAESFTAMRELAGAGSRGGADTATDPVSPLKEAADTGHPLSLRAVASSLNGSSLLAEARPGDQVSALVQSVIESGDGEAVRLMVQALAAVDPPTPATNRLLDVASRTDDPLAKLAALQATLRGEVANPAAVARVVQQADAVLADPNGPPPAYVLAGLIQTTQNQDLAKQALMAGVRFDVLPDDRRAEAIRFIAANAQDPDGLAAGWLDGGLLGSTNRDVVKQTLRILAQHDGGPSAVAPVSDALKSFVFNIAPPQRSRSQPTGNLPPIENLALSSSRHGLFTALQSGDSETRQLAWDALRKFTIDAPRGRTVTDGDNPLDAILDAATAQPTTPPSLVTFLQNQTDGPRTTQALITLAADSDGPLAGRAVRALLKPSSSADNRGSRGATRGRDFASAMRDMEPATRAGFAAAVYVHAGENATPAAQLAADDRAAQWFGDQLRDGVVPPPGDWVEAVGGETQAVDLAGTADDAVAHGALAALAAAAGADTAGQYAVIDQLGAAPREADDLQTRWPGVKQQIRLTQLESAAGDYAVTIEILAGSPEDDGSGMVFNEEPMSPNDPAMLPPDTATGTAPPTIQPMRIRPGVVQLVVETDGVRLVGDPITLEVPDDVLALRIMDPLQLRNFPSDELTDLPLEQATPPLDLKRQGDGSWSGSTDLGPSHTLRVTFDPS